MSDGLILRSPRVGLILRSSQVGTILRSARVGTLLRGERGAAGLAATIGGGFFAQGNFAGGSLIAAIQLSGAGVLTAAASHAHADKAASAQTVRQVTKNGTFATPGVATPTEITAAQFATVTFPAGGGTPTWSYPGGGSYADADMLRVWEAATPDTTLDFCTFLFAG